MFTESLTGLRREITKPYAVQQKLGKCFSLEINTQLCLQSMSVICYEIYVCYIIFDMSDQNIGLLQFRIFPYYSFSVDWTEMTPGRMFTKDYFFLYFLCSVLGKYNKKVKTRAVHLTR